MARMLFSIELAPLDHRSKDVVIRTISISELKFVFIKTTLVQWWGEWHDLILCQIGDNRQSQKATRSGVRHPGSLERWRPGSNLQTLSGRTPETRDARQGLVA
jgi:hypothetical protein